MDTNTTSTKMFSLVVLYDMHTKYFFNALDGISDDDAHNRLNTKANHIAWLTGSLVHERFKLLEAIDPGSATARDTAVTNKLFKDNKGIQDGVTYPSLSDLKKEWDRITPALRKALIDINDEKLEQELDMEGMTMSLYDLIVFITYRESSLIGQVALWRRLLGHKGMNYM